MYGAFIMNTEKIERVQTDLQTMRNAMNLDLPFDEKDIWLMIGMAISLLPPIAVGISWPLGVVEWLSLLPIAVLGLLALFRSFRRSFSRKTNVGMKKDSRVELILGMIVLPSAFVLKKWAPAAGLPVTAVVAVLLVSLGLLYCLLPYWNRTLLPGLGVGFAFLAIGFVAPLFPKDYLPLFAMSILIPGILTSAGIMRWQLNRKDGSSYRG